jgi:hypothetical protein
MKAHEEGFQVYLRGEVEAAGTHYDAAVKRVFEVIEGSGLEPDLAGAVETLSENLRLYSGAIRRMTHFVVKR